MITDQKQTGVPNRGAFSMPTRQRTQLVKPNQVNNVGRSANVDSRGGPAGTFQNAAPRFNPLRPANAAAQVTPRQMPAQQRQPVQPQIQTPVNEPVERAVPTEPISSPAPVEPTPQQQITMSPSPVDTRSYDADARNAISQMSRAEISSLLDAIATGTLKGVD